MKFCGLRKFFIFPTQIYKVYINSKYIYKSFTTRKIISARYNLFTLECDNIYNKFDHNICFEEEKINFPLKDIAYISKVFHQKIHTQKESELAAINNLKNFKFEDNKEDNMNMKFKNIKNKNNYNDNKIKNNYKKALLPSSNK